jgi:bla regulator protein blaR1
MHLLSINELFVNRAVAALCWTFFHSLWQGLIAALLAALILIRTKQSRPASRYQLLTTLFFFLAFVFAVTFLYELLDTGMVAGGISTSGGKITMLVQKSDHPAVARTGGGPLLASVIGEFLSRNSSLIVTIWFIVLSVRMARMFFVLGYTRHMVRHRSHEPTPYWKQRITLLCHQMRITKPVILLESKITRLPIVFGQLKPVILVPMGLAMQLGPDQMEAILLHELAHIRRNDYLVNLAQNIVETLFFFNPALLWLSTLIRDERENCCDDVAIAQLQNKKQYVQSLIRFKERSMYPSSLSAVGFAGRKNSFLNRISRIVENKNYTLSSFEKGSLACSSAVAAFLALAVFIPNGNGLIKNVTKPVQSEIVSRQPMVVLGRYSDTLYSAERLTSIVRRKAGAGAGRTFIKTDTAKFSVLVKVRDTVPQPLHEEMVHKKVPGHRYFFHEKPGPASAMSDPRMKRRMGPMRYIKLVRYVNLESIFADVVDDLVTEGVVKDKSDPVSFLLTNRKLIVNGQLQPESIHERLKEKYISPSQYTVSSPGMAEDPDFGLHYNSQSGASGLGIHHWAENQLP